MATCVITGTIQDVTETALSAVEITFRLTNPIFNSTISTYVPREISVNSTTDGSFIMTLAQSVSGVLTIKYPPNATDSARYATYALTVPASTSAILANIISEN